MAPDLSPSQGTFDNATSHRPSRRRFLQAVAGLGAAGASWSFSSAGAFGVGHDVHAGAEVGMWAATENLVPNAGFEDVDQGWPTGWRPFNVSSVNRVTSSTDHVRTGAHSVRLQDPDGSTSVGVRSADIPVTAGRRYTASAYVFTTAGSIDLYLEFWNSGGTRIGVEFTSATLRGAWTRVEVRGYAPASATRATVLLYQHTANSGVSYADDLCLMWADAANLLQNPGFETLSAGWLPGWHAFNPDSTSRISSATSPVHTGARSVRLTDPNGSTSIGLRSSKVAITAGAPYTASAYVNNSQGSMDVYLEFWNAGGQRISTRFRSNSARGAWSRTEVSAYAPATATHATVLVYQSTGNSGVGYIDDASLTPAAWDRSQIETFETASPTAALVALATAGDTGYLVTRGQTPPKVVTVNLPDGAVDGIARLPFGDGGWAATVSGGKVYVGTYPRADLYRYDPATGNVDTIGTIGPGYSFVWSLATAPDGKVYAGTFPRGEVWEYNPATAALRNLGRASSRATYARAVAADDTNVYVGTIPDGRIIAVNRSTGAKRDITPAGAPTETQIWAITAAGGRVIAALHDVVVDVAPDGGSPVLMTAPHAPAGIDALTVAPDGTLYAAARHTGEVYRRVGNELELVGIVNPDDQTRGMTMRPDGTLIGASGSGLLWYLDTTTGATTGLVDLLDTEAAGPDLAQSIAADGDTAYVGGHYAVTVHRPADNYVNRIRIPGGEAKALLPFNGKILAATYPTTDILQIDPATSELSSLGRIEHGQERPYEMAHDTDRGLILIGTGPPIGRLDGALSLFDLATGDIEVRTDVIPNQSITSVTIDNNIAYVCGDIRGGSSVTPVWSAARVAAFDLDTRSVLWSIAPLANHGALRHIEVHRGVLYGVYDSPGGVWFAMDLATRQIVHRGRLPGWGHLIEHRDHIFAAVRGESIALIGPGLDEAHTLVDLIPFSWFTMPQLAFDDNWGAWGLYDRKLARFDLHPDHRAPGT